MKMGDYVRKEETGEHGIVRGDPHGGLVSVFYDETRHSFTRTEVVEDLIPESRDNTALIEDLKKAGLF